jgi:ligand-binding sensor domain-containing protein
MRKVFMKLSVKIFIALYCIFYSYSSISQGVAIGEWRDHLPYNNCISVTEGNNIVYCATPYAAFSYNTTDNSIERITKVNKLSDIGVSCIKFHKALNVLVVCYNNGNIDIVGNNITTNISDIKNSTFPGNKSINNILFIGNTAYLSCGFGIVVLDLQSQEIEDTYYIGPNGSHIPVFDITTDGINLYAATNTGIFAADLSSPDLSDYQFWQQDTLLRHINSEYNHIIYFNNKLFANMTIGTYSTDTLFVKSNGSWNYFNSAYSANKQALHVFNNRLAIVNEYGIDVFDTSLTLLQRIWTYNLGSENPSDVYIDQNNVFWIADQQLGLVKYVNSTAVSIQPNGPSTSNVINMSVAGSNLWVAPGGLTPNWDNEYNKNGLFSFINGEWATYNSSNIPALDTIYDVVQVCVNPSNPSDVFAATWSRGLLEFNNQTLSTIYSESNSTLLGNGGTGINYRLRVGGICFDANGNMWVSNSGVAPNSNGNTALNVRKADGTWKAIAITCPQVNAANAEGDIVIDQSNQIWMVLPRGLNSIGLLVFNDNGTIDNTSDDQMITLSNATGNGALASNNVYSIAIDQGGEIWVGTDAGISVFYNPGNVFVQGSNFDSQQILVNEGGFIQPLLASQIVTAIAVDGANRKWIGTQNAGLYLMSADGTQQLLYFNTDNSPLFSNTINSIAIDQSTGEVFIGTDQGIESYKGTATQGPTNSFSDTVLVYPNPVPSGYNGTIAIKGLAQNADVSITDISGTLVFSTLAEGGQAIWNGKNFEGDRAQTGVYLVFCASSDGTKRLVSKILLIN